MSWPPADVLAPVARLCELPRFDPDSVGRILRATFEAAASSNKWLELRKARLAGGPFESAELATPKDGAPFDEERLTLHVRGPVSARDIEGRLGPPRASSIKQMQVRGPTPNYTTGYVINGKAVGITIAIKSHLVQTMTLEVTPRSRENGA